MRAWRPISVPMRSSCRTTADVSSTVRAYDGPDAAEDPRGGRRRAQRRRSTEVYIDSGIRPGRDILKALALGADAAMIGRAYIHGLGAMGEAGVSKALQILRAELDTSMALCGERDVNRLRRENLLVPKGFFDSYVQPLRPDRGRQDRSPPGGCPSSRFSKKWSG